ncbi:hypothetical protein ADM90_18655 [Lysinibacillus macroides]|uniref:Uncharacterized protein n=1 Tax=Lysinibacillus macroides TaxID=33935 RepID=A0A0M9DHU4_9BACI|nr:hypothetical protein ADM90_18655 [Lysinibacillus macroides]
MIGMEAATSAGTARAEAPGLSKAREKDGAVPAKRVRRNGNQRHRKKKRVQERIFVPVLSHLCLRDFFSALLVRQSFSIKFNELQYLQL